MATLAGHLLRRIGAEAHGGMTVGAVARLGLGGLMMEGGVGMTASAGAASRRQAGAQDRRRHMAEAALVVMDFGHRVQGSMARVARRLHDHETKCRMVGRGPMADNNLHGGRFRGDIARGKGGIVATRTVDLGAGLAAGNN